jgi:predicted DNA-binding transcriptional regulator AlpA
MPAHEAAAHQGDVLLTRKQTLARIGMSRTWLQTAPTAHDFPPPVRIGTRVLWSQREVAAWIDKQLAKRGAAA